MALLFHFFAFFFPFHHTSLQYEPVKKQKQCIDDAWRIISTAADCFLQNMEGVQADGECDPTAKLHLYTIPHAKHAFEDLGAEFCSDATIKFLSRCNLPYVQATDIHPTPETSSSSSVAPNDIPSINRIVTDPFSCRQKYFDNEEFSERHEWLSTHLTKRLRAPRKAVEEYPHYENVPNFRDLALFGIDFASLRTVEYVSRRSPKLDQCMESLSQYAKFVQDFVQLKEEEYGLPPPQNLMTVKKLLWSPVAGMSCRRSQFLVHKMHGFAVSSFVPSIGYFESYNVMLYHSFGAALWIVTTLEAALNKSRFHKRRSSSW